MIAGIFHQGSGLGNQLHRYVATRCIALDRGYEFGMLNSELFKGRDFMNLKMGSNSAVEWAVLDKSISGKIFNEKSIWENGVDIRGYDPEVNFIEDNTVIDGEFQDERYWSHHEKEVDEWLKVESAFLPNSLCVIGFRGGEYSLFPDLFLEKEYWEKGIKMMKDINPTMHFEVHTDDPELAKKFFPDFIIIQDMALNWRSVRYAKYAIIANSSFFILPRWLLHGSDDLNWDSKPRKDGAVTIAPRYWARQNTKVWALPQNYYKRFTYI